MSDSAELKIERAAKHVVELNELISEKHPFTFICETDTETHKRTAFVKEDEPTVCAVAAISGDIVHNLRTALDHAYWGIVSPHVTTPREESNIQFPFSKTAARLEESIKNRFADRVSPKFFQALIDLKPHGDSGGNELLYLIHQLDALDKHRLLIPTCDETRLPYTEIERILPGFPIRAGAGVVFTRCEFEWRPKTLPADIGHAKPPTTNIFEQELSIPIDICFTIFSPLKRYPTIPTLNKLVDVTREIIQTIRSAP